MEAHDLRPLLNRLARGERLRREEAAHAMGVLMDGHATPAQIGAFLMALRVRGETVDEIVGAAEALRQRMVRVRVEDPSALDTCGTGGDGARTFNLSTAAAFVAAGAGVTVAKHGNHGVSSRCGSADLLERLGFRLQIPPAAAERSLREAGVAFLYAPAFHPAVRRAAGPRKELGVRTLFNALGPLVNPAAVRRQVLGVYAPALLRPVAEALRELGSERVWVVHAEDGLDELSPAAPTRVAELEDGAVRLRSVGPEDFGLKRRPLDGIRSAGAEANTQTMEALLDGRASAPVEEAVAMNAAAAIYVAGRAEGLREALERAMESIRSGEARRRFEAAKRITRDGDGP